MEQVVEWQNRPLDAVYPIDYLDYIMLKICHKNDNADQQLEVGNELIMIEFEEQLAPHI